jgi:hypothetical protein
MKSKKLLVRKKRFGVLLVLPVLLAIVMASSVRTAAAGNGTDKFGPFALTTTDGSSCGGFWALDTFQRSWSVHDNGDGTFLVRRDEKNGTFSTLAGPSPGACSDSAHHGLLLNGGITGQMGGFFMFDVTSNNYNPAGCTTAANCGTTDDFLANVFPGLTDYCDSTCIWNYEYASNDRTLKYRHWQDKSDNAGNDKFEGDIANQ